MRPPDHVEVMCPSCRAAIRVPLSLTMRKSQADDAMEMIADVQIDRSVLDEHVCKDTGCRTADDHEPTET